MYKSKVLYEREEYDEAIKCLQKIIELNSDNYHDYEILGDCYFSNKQFKESINSFTKAIEHNKYDAKLYLKRAKAYFQTDNDIMALKDVNKSLSYNPRYHKTLHLKYEIYNKYANLDDTSLGTYKLEASNYLSQSISTVDDYITLEIYLAEKLRQDCANKFYNDALKVADRLIRLTYDYSYCTEIIKTKIKILFKMHKYLQIILTLILLLRKMREWHVLNNVDIY